MAPIDLAEISFLELDKLFTERARVVKRKALRRKRKNKLRETDDAVEVIHSPSRSRSPRRGRLSRVVAFGGFTSEVDKVEKCIVVSGVPITADEKAVYELFSRCGTVHDVQILSNIYEARTGICIIEFQEDEAVTRACLVANELHGMFLQVKRADAQIKKDQPAPKKMMTRSQFTQQVLSGLMNSEAVSKEGPHMRKLHIKNLRPVVTEEDMQGIFKPFGEFEEFKMGAQECWITFENNNDAQDAMTSMQGFQLVGQELQITMCSVEVEKPPVIMPPPPPAESLDQAIAKDSDFGSGEGAPGRVELMKKLMTSQGSVGTVAGAPAVPPPPAAGGAVVPPPPPASALPPTPKPGGPTARTLLLQNMFTPGGIDIVQEPKFYEEIREDTQEECSKFGKVLHVTVDPRGATGLIYVLYESASQRQAAEVALNGRWFEGKKIIAAGIDDTIWQALAAQSGGK